MTGLRYREIPKPNYLTASECGAGYRCCTSSGRYPASGQLCKAQLPVLGAAMFLKEVCLCRSYLQFEYLEDVLRGGQLPPAALQRCPAVTDVFADDGDKAAAFARGMTGATLGDAGRNISVALEPGPFRHAANGHVAMGASAGNAQEFARRFDFSHFQSFADIGGSAGDACRRLRPQCMCIISHISIPTLRLHGKEHW